MEEKEERFGGFEICLIRSRGYFCNFLEKGSVKDKECIENV
jgi:hypothetical protein